MLWLADIIFGTMTQIKDLLVNLPKLTRGCRHSDSLPGRNTALDEHVVARDVWGQKNHINIFAIWEAVLVI